MKKKKIKRKKYSSKKTKLRNTAPPAWVLPTVLIITAIVYIPSLMNGWTNWDDPTYVIENPAILNLDWSSLLSKPFSLNYHPITMISLGFDRLIWGDQVFGFHLTNLIIHLISVILVFLFVLRLVPERTWFVATFTALLFGIHPMHVESVAWISERKDILYLAFFMGGLITYLKYLKKFKTKWLLITFGLFILSVLSKAMGVVFPVILLLIDWYTRRPFRLKVWSEKVPFLLVSFFFGIVAIKIQSQGAIAETDVFTIWQRFTFGAYGFTLYWVKAFIPFQFSTFYPYPTQSDANTLIYQIMPILMLSVLIGGFLIKNRWRHLSFGIGFYFITVVLVLQFLSVGQAIMADRYTYLPYVGIFFALGFSLDLMDTSIQKFKWISAGLFALLLGILSVGQIKVWKDSDTLWSQVIEHFPNRADEAYANRASYLGKNGELDQALSDVQKALEINPRHADALSTQGNILGSQGKFQEAIQSFNQAIEVNPEDHKYYQNRAISFASLNRFSEAEADFSKAIELSGNASVAPYFNLGIMQLNQGRIQDGLGICQVAYQQFPNHPDINYCMALAFLRSGDSNQALNYARRALQLGYPMDNQMRQQFGL